MLLYLYVKYIYNYVHSVLLQSVSSDRSLASGNKQARPPTDLPESLQGTCHHVAALMRSVFSSHATAVLLQSRQVCTLAVSSLLSLLSELRQTSRATRKLAGVAPRAPVTMFQQSRDQFSAVILMRCCCSRVSSVLWQSVPSSLSSASRYSSQTCRRNEPLRAPNMLAHHKHARPPANHGRYQR